MGTRLLQIAMIAFVATATPALAEVMSPNDWVTPLESIETTIDTRSFGTSSAGGDCNCIDLVLVIDDTGSMTGAIQNVQNGILDIINLAVTTCTDFQGAVLTFKDDVEVDQAMTANVVDVINAVNAITAIGGNFEPEASDEAIREVVDATACPLIGDFDPASLRDGCCSVIILVTDANPGGCDDAYAGGVDDVAAHQRALEAAALGCQIGAVFVPVFGDGGGTIVPVMIDYANTTNGVFGQTGADGSGTADAIEQVILNCIGGGATELCCYNDEDCVNVTEGDCVPTGGVLVDTCDDCGLPTPVEPTTWGRIKSQYR